MKQYLKRFVLYPIIIAVFSFFYEVKEFFKRTVKNYWNNDDNYPQSSHLA